MKPIFPLPAAPNQNSGAPRSAYPIHRRHYEAQEKRR